ncbi:hypothetical protein JHK85_007067 [Glycine max]|nr:hypothetical protein JHK85_007067 [Glycine max]
MKRISGYDDDHALSAATFRLSEYGSDHAPLSFFMGLLHAKLGPAAKRDDVLGLSCALSE